MVIGMRMLGGRSGSFPQLWIEVKRSIGLLAFPVLALAGWLAISAWLPRIALWPEISVVIPNMADLVAPLAGGLAAWMAGRETRRGMDEVLESTSQSPIRRTLTTWVGAVIWAALAYAVVAAGLMGWGYTRATWGAPYWSPILVGLLAVVAWSALGFAAGCWAPSRFTVPLVAVLLFAGLQMLRGPAKYLDPTSRPLHATVFYGLWPAVDGWRSLWLLGLIGVALAGVGLRHNRRLLTWAMLLIGIAASGEGAAPLLQTAVEPQHPTPIPYEPVCVQRSIPICVHPAYREMLPHAAEIIDGVFKPLAGVPGGPRRAEQVAALPQDFRMPADGTMPFRLEEAVRFDWGWQNIAQNSVDILLPGRLAPPGVLADGAVQAQNVVGGWLLQQARIPMLDAAGTVSEQGWDANLSPQAQTAFRRFVSLDPEQQKTWLFKHFQELREGKITLEELP